MKYHFLFVLILIGQTSFSQKTISLSLQSPPATPRLFAEGSISTPINERDFALSPDGKEIYFTISTPKSTLQTIVYCKKLKEGEWTSPEVTSFAGKFSDLEPAFSADGQTLYFSSNRPIEGNETKDFDIWRVKREGNAWGKPENLGMLINTKADEFYPSIAKSGNLYFTAQYNGSVGKEDIYVASFMNGQYQKPVVMDTAINSKMYEFNAFVSPDEDYILFTSYGRKDDSGGGDLYMSVKDKNASWKAAVNLKDLNSAQLDYCPFVSADGKVLFFTSERHQLPTSFPSAKATYQSIRESYSRPLNGVGNIYWVDFVSIISRLRK
ncbi:MAG: PD40 domain-containing protein [Bacteroidetes bacterium]|nr:PD40 domain-containing protein [Bacteroidota bacterium]